MRKPTTKAKTQKPKPRSTKPPKFSPKIPKVLPPMMSQAEANAAFAKMDAEYRAKLSKQMDAAYAAEQYAKLSQQVNDAFAAAKGAKVSDYANSRYIQAPAEALLYAAGKVVGMREVDHGNKVISFQHIANFWNTYLLARKEGPTSPITSTNVAQMMELLKIARSLIGTPIRDHYLDSAGYAAIAWEVEQAQNPSTTSPNDAKGPSNAGK